MAVPSISKLKLVLILTLCILKCMALVAEDQQLKAHDGTLLHTLTPSRSTSKKAKRGEHGFRSVGNVLQSHQMHRSTTISKPSNIVENEGSHQILTTALPFWKEPPPEPEDSTVTWEIKDKGNSGARESEQIFQRDQPPIVKTTFSWRTDSGHTTGTSQSLDKKDQQMEEESTISTGEGRDFSKDRIWNDGTMNNDVEDFDTTPDVDYNNPNIPVSSIILEDPVTERVLAKNERRPDGDTFPCLPCVCFYRHKNVLANCTKRTLDYVPRNLPKETRAIVLLKNHLHSFDLGDLRPYTSLTSLSILRNGPLRSIKNLSQKSQKLPIKEIHICRGNIETIDDWSFKMAFNLSKLSLEINSIRKITNFTFAGLDSLLLLNLSSNKINFIELGAFDHMMSLKVLDLSNNKDLGYSPAHFPPRLFENLHNIQYFGIDGNSHGESAYPNEILENFPNLQTLSIDGLKSMATFQPGMKKLRHLKTLKISKTGRCFMTCVNASFFENIPTVKHISFEQCDHLRLESGTVPIAKHIITLEIRFSHGYDLFTALDDLHVFQNSSLTSLTLVRLIPHSGRSPCRSLRKDQAKNLHYMNLEVLDLSDNFLALVGNDFLKLLPKTLKRLILRDNKLGSIGIGLNRLRILTQLTEVDLSFQSNRNYNENGKGMSRKCRYKPESKTQSRNNRWLPDHDSFSASDTDVCGKASVNRKPQQSYYDTDLDYYDETKPTAGHYFSPLHEDSCAVNLMPPNLKIIRATFFNYFGYQVIGFEQRHMGLKEFYLSNSLLTDATNPSTVLFHVEIVDLSNNYCQHIHSTFFKQNNSVTHLSLQNNLLGIDFADDHHGHLFGELNRARYVDLSNNLIYSLPYRIFEGLTSVHELKLRNNKLQVLNVSFAHMKELRHLDLSQNSISRISKDTMEDLDMIASQHLLTVDLIANLLPCTCTGLDLLYWMSKTNVYFLHQKYLRCRLSNNVHENLGDFKERVKYLQRHCASKAVIIVICVACFVVVAILVGLSLMYRFRWRLRYLRNIAMAKFVGFVPKEEENHNYKFDAYFVFSDDARAFVIRQCLQELEVKRGHTLCISDRNFMPGTYEVSNIVGAVQHSAKTVVVFTPDLYEEDFAEYTIKMALMEEIYNRRSVLHLCVYQPMPDEEMAQCHDLLMVMKRDDYTEYPPEDEVREEITLNFWDKLSRAIGHADHGNIDPDVDDQ